MNLINLQVSNDTSELQITEIDESKSNVDPDLDIDEMNLNIELKIVEDEDIKGKDDEKTTVPENKSDNIATEKINAAEKGDEEVAREEDKPLAEQNVGNIVKNADSENDILNSVSFPKIDIVKYRRNSSVNEDDIRLRRGNLEDFHSLSTKRSKSLNNAYDTSYITYDINLNESTAINDMNGNGEPQKVICKVYENTSRKQSSDTVSSTEKEFLEIDKVRREFEREINRLNAALDDDFSSTGARMSVSEIKKKYDKSDVSSPNPIPKPRRSHYGELGSPVNGNIKSISS